MLAIILMVTMVSCKKDSASDNNGGNGGGNGGGGTNGHEYVDLGLPSGTMWATCNIGANTPQDEGDLFAWGETETKNEFIKDNYKYYVSMVSETAWLQSYMGYNFSHEYQRPCYSKYDDDYVNPPVAPVLDSSDDAAIVNWGNGWRIPTDDAWRELFSNCYLTPLITGAGTFKGIVFTSIINNNTMFLPSSDYWTNDLGDMVDSVYRDGRYYYYRSGWEPISWFINSNTTTFINNNLLPGHQIRRYEGVSIRPVR